MNEKVLKTLEYYKIIKMLENQAGSEPGKKLCQINGNKRPYL